MAAATSVKQIVGSVLLGVLAQPIHEFGHAVALRASTGVWPRIGALSVQPLVPVTTKAAALLVLAAGDSAVLGPHLPHRPLRAQGPFHLHGTGPRHDGPAVAI